METQRSLTGLARSAARGGFTRAGFTLIEVLLVIVIIGMLATVLIVTVGGSGDKARIDTTKLSLQKIESKVELYNLHTGRFPTEADGGIDALMVKPSDEKVAEKWGGPYVQDAELNDAWGNKFNYEPVDAGATLTGGKKFKLWSNGPDAQSSTEDDIKNWTEGK